MNQKKKLKKHDQAVRDGLLSWYNNYVGAPQDQVVDYGTYDPILDQQKRSADRGLGYLTQDTGKNLERATVDYGLGKGQIEQQSGRSLADLLTARQRAQEDVGRQTQTLGQNYARLGNTQRQQAAAAGAGLGGALEQARRKRTANQAQDQSGIDLNYRRFAADSATTEGRLGEDKTSALGDLLKNYSRTTTDLNDTLTRAGSENLIYGQDINELKVDQAKTAGLLPTGGSQHPQADKAARRLGRQDRRVRKGLVDYYNNYSAGRY